MLKNKIPNMLKIIIFNFVVTPRNFIIVILLFQGINA